MFHYRESKRRNQRGPQPAAVRRTAHHVEPNKQCMVEARLPRNSPTIPPARVRWERNRMSSQRASCIRVLRDESVRRKLRASRRPRQAAAHG